MKPLRVSLIACAIAAFAGTAMASSGSLVEFKPQVMPVVVQVNAQGKVTDILPSVQLPPKLRQLLVTQLDTWIVKPAAVKGHPVDSRFIIEVAMQAKPRHDGKYNASFVYVKSLPMPFGGAVHWNIIDGGLQLALVSGAVSPDHGGRVSFFHYVPPTWFNATYASRSMPSTSARMQVTPSAAGPPHAMPTMMSSAISAGNSNAQSTGASHTERP